MSLLEHYPESTLQTWRVEECLKPDEGTCTTLIDGCRKESNLAMAMEIKKKMGTDRWMPRELSYS